MKRSGGIIAGVVIAVAASGGWMGGVSAADTETCAVPDPTTPNVCLRYTATYGAFVTESEEVAVTNGGADVASVEMECWMGGLGGWRGTTYTVNAAGSQVISYTPSLAVPTFYGEIQLMPQNPACAFVGP